MADNKQIATDVLALVGGAENVQVATNCMTRLRLTLVDNAKADVEKIKKVKGVLGCQFSGSQLQVIIGQNVPKVLDEFVAISGVKQGAAVNENLDAPKQKFELKQLPNIILDYLSGSMTQLIPLLMAGGLFRTFAVIIGPMMLNLVPETDPTYTFFYTCLLYTSSRRVVHDARRDADRLRAARPRGTRRHGADALPGASLRVRQGEVPL